MRWMQTVVIVCLALARPAPARADLASTLYGDVRDVIEELIQTEVATSVVRKIETRAPALAFYMHGTLERLNSPYWGSLGRVLKDDLTVVIADFVYWHIVSGGGDGDVVASAKRFFGCVIDGRGAPECKRLVDAIGGQKRPLLEVECRRAKPKRDQRVACHIGLAVAAALKHRGEVRAHLVDALSEIVLSEVADNGEIGGRLRDVLTKWLDLPRDLPVPLIEALANPDLAQEITNEKLEERCKNPQHHIDALNNPTERYSWLCFAITHPAVKDNYQTLVVVKDAGQSMLVPLDYWQIESIIRNLDSDRASDDTAFRILGELAYDDKCNSTPKDAPQGVWPCTTPRFAIGSKIEIILRGGRSFVGQVNEKGTFTSMSLSGKPVPPGGLLNHLVKVRTLAKHISELRSLVPPALSRIVFHAGKNVNPNTRQALRSAARMARLVSELRSRWYLWSQQHSRNFEEIDVAELLEVARFALDNADESTKKSLAFLDKQATGAASIDIGDWLRMVMRADYRSLAMESLRSALNIRLGQQNRPHETFFLSLAAYLLDQNEGVGESVARAAFRASAKELLLSVSHRGVPRVGDRVRFRITPRLALRLSINEAYQETDGDNRRTLVAADWPTAMLAINDYVGIEASVIDLIAPLGEMALRPAGRYTNERLVALDFVRPRGGIWVAAPQLSRRISLNVGVGARFLSVTRVDDMTDDRNLTVEYKRKTSLTFDAGLQFVF